MFILLCIMWYLVGFALMLLACYSISKNITVVDIIVSALGAILGPVISIVTLPWIIRKGINFNFLTKVVYRGEDKSE